MPLTVHYFLIGAGGGALNANRRELGCAAFEIPHSGEFDDNPSQSVLCGVAGWCGNLRCDAGAG
ncbi:MAG: hypothetical protein ACRCV5_14950, partial [Afipia sp.]